jgi:hypothetical protein
MGYKSTNQMADVGNKIRKYIQEFTSVSVASNKEAVKFAANVSKESKAKDAQLQAMTAQIQALAYTVATLSTQIAAAAKNGDGGSGGGAGGGSGGSGGGGGGSGGGGKRTFKFTRNMGAYCSTHGHHPVGANTPAQHAPTNTYATMTLQPLITILVAATSGWDYPRSNRPSRTM